MMKLWSRVAVLILITQNIVAHRILALFPFSGKSHFMNCRPLLEELADRGHHVTVVTVFKTENPKPNYEEIIADKKTVWDFIGENVDIFQLEKITIEEMINLIWDATFFTNEAVINSTNFQHFLKNDNSHYDLIFTEIFYQESLYMFAHKYKAPIVGLSTIGYSQSIGDVMGNSNILPYMAHEFANFGKELTFFQRLANIYVTAYDLFWRKYYLLPKHQKLAEKHFNHLSGPLPMLEDIERNISLIFINSHFSYERVTPLVPGIVEIAGTHIKKPKELPGKIQKFLDGAEDGVIYFNFGSNIKIKDMSKEKLEIFINVFKKVKQRIIWKWEDESYTGMPDNVMIATWLPQNDILAHPNVKLFITHGGLFSTQEAVYHGVPMIGFPFYGDQFTNLGRVESAGYGVKLLFSTLTEDIFTKALNEVLNNPKYWNKAKELANRFQDRPLSAMDTAVFWIEYVIRHKGATFMKSPIASMTSIQYHMLDSIAFIIFVLVALLYIVKWNIKFLARIATSSSKSRKPLRSKGNKQN